MFYLPWIRKKYQNNNNNRFDEDSGIAGRYKKRMKYKLDFAENIGRDFVVSRASITEHHKIFPTVFFGIAKNQTRVKILSTTLVILVYCHFICFQNRQHFGKLVQNIERHSNYRQC